MPARVIWILTGLLFSAWLGLGFAAVVVHHRQEQCVKAVLSAQRAHLSTWEAVERCQR